MLTILCLTKDAEIELWHFPFVFDGHETDDNAFLLEQAVHGEPCFSKVTHSPMNCERTILDIWFIGYLVIPTIECVSWNKRWSNFKQRYYLNR